MPRNPLPQRQRRRFRYPRGPVRVGWQASQGIPATMGSQAEMAEMAPPERRVRKEMQVLLVLKVTLVTLECLGLQVPEAFQEPQAGKENLEKVLTCTAQHSVWGWRPMSPSPMSPFASPRSSIISRTTTMVPQANSTAASLGCTTSPTTSQSI